MLGVAVDGGFAGTGAVRAPANRSRGHGMAQKDGTQPGVLPGLFGALEARYGRLCGEEGVRSGAGIGAAVDQ